MPPPLKLLFLLVSHSLICIEQGPKEFSVNLNLLTVIEATGLVNRSSPISDAQCTTNQGTSMEHTPEYV